MRLLEKAAGSRKVSKLGRTVLSEDSKKNAHDFALTFSDL